MTAESKYYLAEIEFKANNFKECQKIIFEIQKQVPSYDFWIAKGFILLGDTYMAQNDSFQAKETYKSIVENYEKGLNDPEDIVTIAKQKFDAVSMNDSEKSKKEDGTKDSKDDDTSDDSGEE